MIFSLWFVVGGQVLNGTGLVEHISNNILASSLLHATVLSFDTTEKNSGTEISDDYKIDNSVVLVNKFDEFLDPSKTFFPEFLTTTEGMRSEKDLVSSTSLAEKFIEYSTSESLSSTLLSSAIEYSSTESPFTSFQPSTTYFSPSKTQESYSTSKFDFSLFSSPASSEFNVISDKTTEKDEIIEMTMNYHMLRVTLSNQANSIQAQEKVIKRLKEIIQELENHSAQVKLKHEHKMNELIGKNENCRVDFNRVKKELEVAKKIIAMENYSKGLKSKLGEFGVTKNSTM